MMLIYRYCGVDISLTIAPCPPTHAHTLTHFPLLPPTDSLVILDEAHNLESFCCDSTSLALSSGTVALAMEEVDAGIVRYTPSFTYFFLKNSFFYFLTFFLFRKNLIRRVFQMSMS
jgi:hypothetical protein